MFCKSVEKDLSSILLYVLATVIYLFFSNWVAENTHTPIWVDWKAPELMKYLASKSVWSRRKTSLLLSPTLTASLFDWPVTPHAQGTLHSTTLILWGCRKEKSSFRGIQVLDRVGSYFQYLSLAKCCSSCFISLPLSKFSQVLRYVPLTLVPWEVHSPVLPSAY